MLTLIRKALENRFGPTEKDPVIHAASEIMDLNEWPGDMQSLATFRQEQLNLLLQHFQDSLTRVVTWILSKQSGRISRPMYTDNTLKI